MLSSMFDDTIDFFLDLAEMLHSDSDKPSLGNRLYQRVKLMSSPDIRLIVLFMHNQSYYKFNLLMELHERERWQK